MKPHNNPPGVDQRPRLGLWKKAVFALAVTIAFFALIEVGLAIFGVKAQLYDSDPYVGFSSLSPLFVETTDPDGTVVMERARNKFALFNRQRFPAHKSADVYRVFCVGGSTTYGRPYDDQTSFCGWLREFLQAADSSRRWEVINAGGISYASYRVAVLMEELIRYDPDLFIIYSGHNEFLERRSYPQIIATPRLVRGVGTLAARTRIYTALKTGVDAIRGTPSGDPGQANVLDAEVTTLLDQAVGPSEYTRNDELREKVLQHYRFNLVRMIDIARSAGAELIMVTPASNLRDATPFKSEHREGLGDGMLARWRELLRQGLQGLREGRYEAAMAYVEQATAIDDRYAALHHLRGQILEQLGRFEGARAAYERARDEDVCPLRALGPMSAIVRDVAAARAVPVVDFELMVHQASVNGIPGQEHFFDHVHPVIAGHRMIALAAVEMLRDQGVVSPEPGWGEAAVGRVIAQVEGRLDPRAHAIALTNLSKVLAWAGKLTEAHRLAQQAVAAYPEDSKIQYQAGLSADLVGRLDQAMAHYRRAIEIQPDADLPHGNLAVGLEKRGNLREAVDHYRLAYKHSGPDDIEHHRRNLAEALMKLAFVVYSERRFDEAIALLEEANEVMPSNEDILGRLATAQLGGGRTTEAISTLETAIEIRDDHAPLYNRLALAFALAGRPASEVASMYRRALDLDAGVVDLPDNLLLILERGGRGEQANEIRRSLEESTRAP